MFVPVGLLSFLRNIQQVLLSLEVSSVARLGKLTVGASNGQFRHPTIPTEDVVRTTKDLQGRTRLIEWDVVKSENKDNSNFDSN